MDELENTETTEQEQNSTDTEQLTFTREELDTLLQKEGDKRVTQALAKQERKFQAQMRESEKLTQMNEEQRRLYDLEKREALLAEKERALTLAENKNVALKILAEKGLSLTLVDFVIADDAETMNSNINILDRAFKASVKAEVEKRIGGKTPQTSTVAPGTLTREQFSKMSLAEKQNLFNTDRELYNSLIN